MQINLLIKTFVVAFFLLGLSIKSAVSAGGSDEEVFPPKTLEKLKKTYSSEEKAENKKKSNTGTKKNNNTGSENNSLQSLCPGS